MVRLYASLLTLALAAGSALAFSDEYHQRRNEIDSNLYRRYFIDGQETFLTREDYEDLYAREIFEAREPQLKIAGPGGKILNGILHKIGHHHHHASSPLLDSRGLEHDDEELFGRDLDAEELFGREYDYLEGRDIFDDLD